MLGRWCQLDCPNPKPRFKNWNPTRTQPEQAGTPVNPEPALNRLCIHTMTTKPWSLDDCARHYPKAGVHGITVWRQHLAGYEPQKAGTMLRDAGLEIVSL